MNRSKKLLLGLSAVMFGLDGRSVSAESCGCNDNHETCSAGAAQNLEQCLETYGRTNDFCWAHRSFQETECEATYIQCQELCC
jgi:hypothetical protein